MSIDLDLRVTELLASRICHDLISPVGAINNGVELLEDMGAQVGEEAVKLIGHSAEQAARRLRLFRISYGAAGADANLSCDEALGVLRDYLGGSRVSLIWQPEEMKNVPASPRGLPKVLLNVMMVAVENLVHGGTIEIKLDAASHQLRIAANGRACGTRTDAWAPLAGDVAVPDLTAKSVHPYVTKKFSDYYKVTISWQQPQEDQLQMTLGYTPAANS